MDGTTPAIFFPKRGTNGVMCAYMVRRNAISALDVFFALCYTHKCGRTIRHTPLMKRTTIPAAGGRTQ
mgnify:CR=1 FL=1|jgi:hypothetical protein